MKDLNQWLLDQVDIFVLDKTLEKTFYKPIDLSEKNDQIIDITNKPIEFEKYIDCFLEKSNAKVAFGGYLEKRLLYNRSAIFQQEDQDRNIHIGLDLWTKAGTKVLAALDGKIFSLANNKGIGNYGPTVIIEHQLENKKFWTLYGHLSSASVAKLQIGDSITKSQIIAELGEYSENGDYAPHLHFQIIKNIDNSVGDYAGVCSNATVQYYKENCPDPNLLLKL